MLAQEILRPRAHAGWQLEPVYAVNPPADGGGDNLPDGVPDAAGNPIVVYTMVLAMCVWIASVGLAKVIGPLGDAISAASERRRDKRQRDEDARILDLSAQVDHLAGRVYTLEARQQRQDSYLYAHALWDHEVLEACLQAGLEVGEPPPLRPPLDAP